jgi:hypothetical protein
VVLVGAEDADGWPKPTLDGLWKESMMDLQKDPLTGFQLDHRTKMVDPNQRWMGLRKDSLMDL